MGQIKKDDSVVGSQQEDHGSNFRLQDLVKTIPLIKKLTFVSDPLRRTYKSLRLPLHLNEPGCWFEAASGEGKSTAVEYCRQSLLAELPSLPVFSLNEHTLPAAALRDFFIRMLSMCGHPCLSGETARLRLRLAKHLSMLAMECPLNIVVLLIDEGQAFRDIDLLILKDLSNDMERYGAGLLTFIFGEAPAMTSRVDSLMCGNNKGVALRFIGGHRLTFHPYKSISDWNSLFSEIDQQRFDCLGGRTLAEHYFRFLDISEFCFVNEVEAFWASVNKRRAKSPALNLRRIFIGFRWVILNVIKSGDGKIKRLPYSLWEDAFDYAACCNYG